MTSKSTSKSIASASGTEISFGDADFDHELYAFTAQSARLEDIKLRKNDYRLNVECLSALDDPDTPLKSSFVGGVVGHQFNSEAGFLVGAYSWVAEVKVSRKKAVKLNCEFFMVYSGLTEVPQEYAQLYFKKVARFTSYPYFRAQFATQVAASGLLLPPLPSLRDRVD